MINPTDAEIQEVINDIEHDIIEWELSDKTSTLLDWLGFSESEMEDFQNEPDSLARLILIARSKTS